MPEDVPLSTKYSDPAGGTKPRSKTGSTLPPSVSVPLVMRPDAAGAPGGPAMPKASSPSGSLAIVDDASMATRAPGATPMVPSFVRAEAALVPRSTTPFTVSVPEFRIGPSTASPGSPDVPDGCTVSDPAFSNPDDTVRTADAVAVVEVLAVVGVVAVVVSAGPMVRLLPAETVS